MQINNEPTTDWTFPPHGLTCPCVSARTCRRPSGRTSFCSSSLVWRRQEMAPPPRPPPSAPCWVGSPGGEKTHLLRFIPPSVRWSLAGYRRHVCQHLRGARHKPAAEAIFCLINCFSGVKWSKSSLPSSVPMMKPPRKTKDVIIHLQFTVLSDFETLTECESWSRSSGGGLLRYRYLGERPDPSYCASLLITARWLLTEADGEQILVPNAETNSRS